MVYEFFDKKTGLGISLNEQLAQEVTKKFKRRKIYARFKDNIQAADVGKMKSLTSKNKNVNYFLLYFIDVFIKNAWVKALQDKKS